MDPKAWAVIALLAWYVVGLTVLTRLEMRLRGVTFEYLRRSGSADESVFFKRTSGVMALPFIWPFVWLSFRNHSPGEETRG